MGIRYGPRIREKELGGGLILDMSGYEINLVSQVYGGDAPLNISANGFLNENGVDMNMEAALLYSKCRTAVIATNGNVAVPGEAVIVGTKGIIRVRIFHYMKIVYKLL